MGQAISRPFPPPPRFTEKDLPDQTGKVFIVTGTTSGIGQALSGVLYGANAKVYMAARSHDKALAVASELKKKYPTSKGQLIYLHLDLNDLATIKKSADEFLAKEDKLHVLFNNAGVMFPPKDNKTAQGYELQLGINALAPFLFTKLLTPVLLSTVKTSAPGDVRVVWVSSSFSGYFAPDGGVSMDNINYQVERHPWVKYAISKAANTLYSAEVARRYGQEGIISVSLDPGTLKTELFRNSGFLFRLAMKAIEYDPIYGAYTELFGGLSPEITLERNNVWIAPWGRIEPLRRDIDKACRTVDDGGTGNAQAFWEWSEQQVEMFA
ncbi:retinol dehydrogenase 12 [Biscogniauxia mediterranea]|nr:retinol dehydrogenase 12 [Biscogniauxia mediterranea]